MHCAAPGSLLDLVPATEAIGQDRNVGPCGTDARQQHALPYLSRKLIFSFLDAEGPGHSAAARGYDVVVDPKQIEQFPLAVCLDDCVLVAVKMNQGSSALPSPGQTGGVFRQEIAEEDALTRQSARQVVRREEVDELFLERREAGGLEPDQRRTRFDVGLECIERLPPQGLGIIEPSPIIKRPTTAERPRRDRDIKPLGLEQARCCNCRLRLEVIVEGIGPEQDPATLRLARLASVEPAGEGLGSNRGYVTMWGDSCQSFGRSRHQRSAGDEIEEPRGMGCDADDILNPAHRIGRSWTPASIIMVRPELGFVGRHVDIDRTITLASLAGQAQIERFLDRRAAPSLVDRPAMKHFEKQPRAPARRMSLLMGGDEARTHDLVMAVVTTTLAHPDATLGGAIEIALKRIREMGLELRRPIAWANAQIGGDGIGIDDLARIHSALGIPDRLEFAKCLDELRAIHFFEKLATGLTIAVLSRKRAIVADDKLCRLVEEAAPFLNSGLVIEVEGNRAMHQAVPEMAVQAWIIPIAVEQRVKVAQIGAEVVAMNRGILPTRPCVGMVGDVGLCPKR